jgi:hypothetical protein
VRVRDHIVLSTAGTALLYRWAGRRVLGAWVGSIFIDVDHYLWFCWRQRTVDPLAALRFFNTAGPPHHPGTRLLHILPVPLSVLLLGARRQGALPVALGMILHVAMDAYHEARMGEARAAALRRDHATCQACGASEVNVSTHLSRQPWLLPSYRVQNLITLCSGCHEAAHALATRSGSRFGISHRPGDDGDTWKGERR